nr:hypothetical protein [Tanacetum cinerariifolium]
MHVIEQPIPLAPASDFKANVLAEWNVLYDAHNEELRSMFEKQASVERFDLIQTFHACKQEEGKPVGTYVLEMKDYVEQLERLGYVLPQDHSAGLILNGITSDFAGFVRNYNMHNMRKTIGEIHALLIEYEKGLPKKAETPQVMMIKSGKIQKANKRSLKAKGKGKTNGKGKEKQGYIPKPKNPKPAAKENPAKDDTCHYCKEVGHWKRNCHVYLAELLKKKKKVGISSSSSIFTIELFSFPNRSCVYDTGCVSKNNVFYFNAIPSNGIHEIDMHDLIPNANSIYNVSTKRAKHNLNFTYLWHCRLAHISTKRIEKLQHAGFLKSTDDESFDQCVSCLASKITRKSFPHRLERATDLLGIIHIDVCGPLRHVPRQGASYFIIFTDDYSHYCYVYLLKHKHKLTPPYTPQHNGASERRNHTLLDMVQSMMNLITLPLSFWDYALESATSILNMVPTKKQDTLDKLQQRSVKCIFIGYPKETMGYYFYFPPKNKIVVVRYAEFFEKKLITQEVSGRAIDLEEIQDEDTSPFEITSKIPMEVKGFKLPQKEHSLEDLNEPTSYKAAMLDSESNKWIDAMNAEIQSMMDKMVWVLVDLPPGSRLVSKGYTQLYGVDYEETFSPITDIRAIRILISITVFYDYEIWQMDVKNAFLNGYLDEDIYMASRSNVTFLILYVDDIIIMGNHIPSLQSVKDYLGKCFAMNDLGEAAFIP